MTLRPTSVGSAILQIGAITLGYRSMLTLLSPFWSGVRPASPTLGFAVLGVGLAIHLSYDANFYARLLSRNQLWTTILLRCFAAVLVAIGIWELLNLSATYLDMRSHSLPSAVLGLIRSQVVSALTGLFVGILLIFLSPNLGAHILGFRLDLADDSADGYEE